MAKITFVNSTESIEIPENITIAEAVRQAGFIFETPCGGKGHCGKCRIRVAGKVSPKSEEEKRLLGDAEDGVRLGCHGTVVGDFTILSEGLKKAKKDPKMEQLGRKNVVHSNGFHTETFSPMTMDNTGVYNNFDIKIHRTYTVCIDIGTTGISMVLFEEEGQKEISEISFENPQIEYGADVLTRIQYSIEQENGLEQLQKSVVRGINEVLQRWETLFQVQNKVTKMIISANTTMLHILAGKPLSSLAKAPYKAIFLERTSISPPALGIHLSEEAELILLPSASAYVGADIISGAGFLEMKEQKKPVLFIDIGTNGEIVLSYKGKLIGTSTAAGPALEGANISCGCRACEGAIERVKLENGDIELGVIGNLEPIGICGSGLIDLTGVLIREGIILPNGKISEGKNQALNKRVEGKCFRITETLSLTQKDVRQIQLAKGAISAGILMLLKEIGLRMDEIPFAIIGGTFGFHIDPENLREVGILPKSFSGEIKFMGNTSLKGAKMAAKSAHFMDKLDELAKEMTVIELSTREDFQEHFIRGLSFSL